MGRLFTRALTLGDAADQQGRDLRSSAPAAVTRASSLRAGVKWAALRLRADLISTTPLDVFRRVNGVQVEMPKPLVLRAPGGARMEPEEWFYSTQMDLDEMGNCFGIIAARDSLNLPTMIELVPVETASVHVRKGKVTYRLDGQELTPDKVWHERQFTTSGSVVGLSPTAHAAMVTGGYLSAQAFAADWFAGSAVPAAHLKNTAKTLKPGEAAALRARHEATVRHGGVLVTGSDWTYDMIGAKASEAAFLEMVDASAPDLCRFFGVPGDVIDVHVDSSTITYANITQRNLQLLILNLGPTYTRRERRFSSGLLPAPRYAKWNTDALLRMDPASRYAQWRLGIDGRFLAPSEAREMDNRQPFTPEQLAEFDRLFPARSGSTPPTKESTP